MIRGTLALLLVWVFLLLGLPPAFAALLLFRRLDFVYAEARFFIRLLFWVAGVRLVIHGRVELPAERACVYMSNHLSNVDPPLLLYALPGQMSVLAKKELFSVPLLGWVMRLGELVPVDRSDKDASHAAIDLAAERLAAGRPFLVFPEGTRSLDGMLLPFKRGSFVLAEKGQAPIVPVTLKGTREIMPKGSLRLRPGRVDVHIHSPIWPAEYPDRSALVEAVRASIGSPEERF